MITFTVSDPLSYTKSPMWWIYFSHDAWKAIPDYQLDYLTVRNAELEKYGGKFYSDSENKSKKYVSFINDEDATFFILRWT